MASTSEVYGLSRFTPFREDGGLVLGATTNGRWSYACSKAIEEFITLAYYREMRQPTVVVRLFNTVGPRQTGRYGMVVPTFVKQALNNEPITVFGDGTQSRCFTFVKDAVEALIGLMGHPGAVGQVFNVGSQEEVTIGELAKMVKTMTDSRSEIVMVPYDEAYEPGFEDMPRRVPDIAKVRELIGFNPKSSLQKMLENVIQFERDRMARSTGRQTGVHWRVTAGAWRQEQFRQPFRMRDQSHSNR